MVRLNFPETEAYYTSPRFFGAENEPHQETLIVDEPLVITAHEYSQLQEIAKRAVAVIDTFDLRIKGKGIGADPEMLGKSLEVDGYGDSCMRYGGLDVYQDPTHGFKILEINPRVQAMGLQDFRQKMLGISEQPRILEHFLEWVEEKSYKNVLVLGSHKNPFWRAYQKVTDQLDGMGVNAIFCDARTFIDKYRDGFVPDLILKFCNNNVFIKDEFSAHLEEIIRQRSIPIVNSLGSAYFGYRGFMQELANREPGLLPEQRIFSSDSTDEELERYPWVKLEASGKAYVVNYGELRRWGKNVLLFLINGGLLSAEKLLDGKDGGDARRLKEVIGFIRGIPNEQVVWIGQSNVEPRTTQLKVGGVPTELKILHRVYWFKKHDGELLISLEGFGCTHEQFERSKGKINAGTGVAVPMVIK